MFPPMFPTQSRKISRKRRHLETVENTDKFDSGCACATVLSLCTILPECQEQFIQLVTIFYLKPFHYPF
jgi:hypothetical protein